MFFETWGEIKYNQNQKDRYKNKELPRKWFKQYPNIFDEDDLRITQKQAEDGYHFYEWLTAVVLFEQFGLLSLVEQYQFKNHLVKQSILNKILSKDLFELITNHSENFGNVQCPDLFVYKPDLSDWFIVEVKGDRDKLRDNQRRFFSVLSENTNKPVYVVNVKRTNEEIVGINKLVVADRFPSM
jgi:hypothetical protein